jgi:hypothetical protein
MRSPEEWRKLVDQIIADKKAGTPYAKSFEKHGIAQSQFWAWKQRLSVKTGEKRGPKPGSKRKSNIQMLAMPIPPAARSIYGKYHNHAHGLSYSYC